MSLSVQLGLLLALATALTSVPGFLSKHRGARAALVLGAAALTPPPVGPTAEAAGSHSLREHATTPLQS